MTPEQKRIVALEQVVEKLQKNVKDLSTEQGKQTKMLDKLHQGALRLERAVKSVEVIARRGVANAATNSNSITAILRRFKK